MHAGGTVQVRAESAVRVAVVELLAARVAGASPGELAPRFGAGVDLGLAGVGLLGEALAVEHIDLDTIRAEGDRAVATGTGRARVRATGVALVGEFALDVAVGPDGLINRYDVLEDRWTAAGPE
ncbi:hypothetical protein GCM10010413_23450 [Promicromonospora sukumoe]|uniref:SnoaL-like protein n=1 Tax=Promicromonospora sukumoe TaxID=88382 RepID=A0A7W3PED0_9MICO|nr:hypothetical protein [Promicromonospora sukumoe]MBA8808437.1 hypothetical protein [Promicromonospora sukumoe]